METIEFGRFDSVDDYYILQLQPIVNTTGIVSYTDSTTGIISGSREFEKKFRYKLDDGAWSSWITLGNTELQAISVTADKVLWLEVKYTRIGSITEGNIRWKKFTLNNVTVQPKVKIRINKANYDSVYGDQKYLDIVAAVSKFNYWSIPNTGIALYVKDDNTVLEQAIAIDNVTGSGQDIDFNTLLKTEYGKRLIKLFFDLNIDVNKPKT